MRTCMILILALTPVVAFADPDPAIMEIQQDVNIRWIEYPGAPGLKYAVLYGHPPAQGPYVIRVRIAPGIMSPPHFHPEERQIVVLKGTWWVGSGPKPDRNALTPVPVGGFVVHHANQIHYDGARDEEVIVQISGIGTNATTLVDESGKPM